MRELILIKQTAKLVVELVVLVVAYFQDAVFHAISVAKIFAQLMLGNFDYPAIQVFAIEQADPLTLIIA